MDIERLTHLRDLLRADAANPKGVKFDLSSWAAWGDDHGHSQINWPRNDHGEITIQPAMSCGTFACALGLAALDPVFIKQGLTLGVQQLRGTIHAWMVPRYQGQEAFEAGALFFEITDEDSKYLFDPDCYHTTPVEAEGELFVAQRVDDLINGIIDDNYHPAHR